MMGNREARVVSPGDAAELVIAFSEDFWAGTINEGGRDIIRRFCAAAGREIAWFPETGAPNVWDVPALPVDLPQLWIEESLNRHRGGSLILSGHAPWWAGNYWLEIEASCGVGGGVPTELWMARAPAHIAHLLRHSVPRFRDQVWVRWEQLLVEATPADLVLLLANESRRVRTLALQVLGSIRRGS